MDENKSFDKYKTILRDIWGEDIEIQNMRYNNVIGALSDDSNFETFNTYFIDRLKRIHNEYPTEEILTKMKSVANNSWEGAYSELAVYDWILSQKRFGKIPLEFDIRMDSSESFAGGFGKPDFDTDGYIPNTLFFDVKALVSNESKFLDNVIDKANAINPLISYSFYDVQSAKFIESSSTGQNGLFKDLLSELNGYLSKNTNQSYESKFVKGLNIDIVYGKHSTAISTLNPYYSAMMDAQKIFRYATKFTKSTPFVLFVVWFPWFNREISSFCDFNKTYYRSLARRVFCQYIDSDLLFKNVVNEYTGSETIYDVTKKLSAIIFLEDHSIQYEINDETYKNVDCESKIGAYVYLNPNADNPIKKHVKKYRSLISGVCDYDDFEFDNY